ncbi:MAG: thiaminase II, partial [Pseudomonadota bacterium]
AATVNGLLAEEVKLHVGVCAEAGISKEDLFATVEREENMAYTRYVMDAGFSGDFPTLLAALAPCVLGYGEIGARLTQEKTSKTYSDWIATYGGHDYQTSCATVGALLEDALVYRYGENYDTLPVWEHLSDTFLAATRLEVGFWQMGLTP